MSKFEFYSHLVLVRGFTENGFCNLISGDCGFFCGFKHSEMPRFSMLDDGGLKASQKFKNHPFTVENSPENNQQKNTNGA